ncbi:MAG: hypothetical protein ACUVUC_10900 [Thermoguttaceae bacterium]
MSPPDPSPPSGQHGGSRPGKADWRGKARPAGPFATAQPAKGPAWRQKTDQEYLRARRRYRVLLSGLVLAVVALTAWLSYLWLYPQFWRRTPVLAIAVTQYGETSDGFALSALPPNGWASEDVDRFELLGAERIAEFSKVEFALWETGLEGLRPLRERIRQARGGGPDRNALIVYMSMHGAVNKQKEACLIPPGVSPLESDQWLPLDKVLHYLFPEEDKERLPARKLLILDCNRMDANWRLGLLYNGFADELEAAWRRAGVPGLVILNSAGPGQIGWTSPERLQGSVFGYHVWKGLMGAADRDPEANGDGQVSLKELHQYVRKYVSQQVSEDRADLQEPLLVPSDAQDFALVYALSERELDRREAEWGGSPAPRDPRWAQIAPLWEKHAELERRAAWRWNPLRWEQFQRGLMRLEELVQAGAAYQSQFETAYRFVADLAAELGRDPFKQDPRTADLAGYSLPLERWLHGDANVEAEAERLYQQWSKMLGKLAPQPGQNYSYLAAAAALWRWCLEHPEPDRWPEEMFKLLDRARASRKADLIEIHFLRMLRGPALDPELRRAGSNLVKQALWARQAAESVAAPGDERVHYWLHQLLDTADAQRRLAEDLLFLGHPAALRDAEARLAALVGPDGHSGKYAEAEARARAIRGAYAARDRAWARTPYLAEWLLARLHETDPAPPEHLASLLQSVRILAHELDSQLARQTEKSAAVETPSPGLQEAQQAAEKALAELETAFRNQCLVERLGTDRQVLKRLATVLAVPLVTGQERNGLRGRYLDILYPETPARSSKPSAPGSGPPEPSGLRIAKGKERLKGEDPQARFLERLGRWAQHPALAILQTPQLPEDQGPSPLPEVLAGKRAAAPEEADQRAAREKHKKALVAQGEEVRRILASVFGQAARWMRQSEAKLKLQEAACSPAESRSGLSKADRLVRATAALWAPERSPWSEPGSDPVFQLRRLDLYRLLVWQAYRVLEDFWGPAPEDPAAAPWFDVVAGEYLASARALCQEATGPRYGQSDLAQLVLERRQAVREGIGPLVDELLVVPGDLATPLEAAASVPSGVPAGQAAFYLRSESDGQVLPLFRAAEEAEKQGLAGLRRLGIPVPQAQWRQPCWVRNRDVHGADSRLESKGFEAVAWYRGHRRSAPFSAILPGAGWQIVYEPPTQFRQWVTVKGSLVAESYVVFILDYSGTMYRRVSSDAKARRCYEEARDKLLDILMRLARIRGRPYRVAVMIYGHRVNFASSMVGSDFPPPAGAEIVKWDPNNPNRVISADADQPRIHPSQDVQLFWPRSGPPTVLTEQDVEEIRRRLEPLKALGETPLYLAINQAIDLLSQVGDGSARDVVPSRHIIVITDGVNEQTEHMVGVEEVRQRFARAGKDIRLDVLPFRFLGADQAQVEDLKRLVREQGGEFLESRDTSTLEKNLNRSLRLSQYLVYREGAPASQIAALEPKELGDPTEIKLQPADLEKEQGVPFVVKLVDPSRQAETKVRIHGNEALLLHLSEDGKALYHERYQAEQRDARPDLPDPTDRKRRVYIAAHQPAVQQGKVRFFFSVQNQDERAQSLRPAEAWVEIQPQVQDRQNAPVYVFYDMLFRPDCPVPVLECVVPGWREEAVEAEARLWCKFSRTPPEEVLRVGEFAPKKRAGLALELRQQADDKQGRHHVIVTERYERRGDPRGLGRLGALKIEMDPPPLKIVRHYIPEAGIVRHTFSYPAEKARSGQLASYLVRITPREQVLKEAVAVEPPLRFRIPREATGPR